MTETTALSDRERMVLQALKAGWASGPNDLETFLQDAFINLKNLGLVEQTWTITASGLAALEEMS